MEKQKITDLMNSRFGSLAAQFILEAVRREAKSVSNSDPSTFTNPLRGGEKWHSVALEISKKLERL